jgi:hypothetical protein
MRAKEFVTKTETYTPPTLAVGDKILKGKFKNSPAEIKGFKKDKHNQPVLKTNKGDIQLFKPRVTKLMKEGINPDILDLRFRHTQKIGDFTYTAETVPHVFNGEHKSPFFVIKCFEGDEELGSATFYTSIPNCLMSALTSVDPRRQREGIASTMYAYARMLGNTIEPSGHQLRPGKNMWKTWKRRGDDVHLMKEDYRTTKYDFHREPDNWFVATADGVEIGRFQGKSQFDSGAAQDAAKKCIMQHRGEAASKKHKEDEHRFQFEKPLSDVEKRWALIYHRLYVEHEQGTEKEYDNLSRWAEVVRKSIRSVQNPMEHPLVKAFMADLV